MEFNGTFLATIITFVIFVFLMNKILYAPILEVMEKRKSYINDNFRFKEEADVKIAELTNEIEEKQANAKEEARGQYLEVLSGFKNERAEIISNAQIVAKEELEQSKIELENVSNEVKQALKGSMTDLANDIVEKVIGYRSEVQGFDEDVVNKVLWDK